MLCPSDATVIHSLARSPTKVSRQTFRELHSIRHLQQCAYHIGVDRTLRLHRARGGNLLSVREHPSLVDHHISEERAAGRLLGLLPAQLASGCQISPIGLIPKPHQLGKWRLIVDLSSPQGGSVNDAISVDHCHMHYASVLQAAASVRQLGPGTLLAKMDFAQASRIVPVHADDHPLLGIQWRNNVFVDTALPF